MFSRSIRENLDLLPPKQFLFSKAIFFVSRYKEKTRQYAKNITMTSKVFNKDYIKIFCVLLNIFIMTNIYQYIYISK